MNEVVVTGADGFIGSHLVELLLQRGVSVRALTQYNSFNDWGWLETFEHPSSLTIHSGDVRDPQFCRTLLDGADTVFHLAALIAIPYSYIAPDAYVDTNVRGTLNICQAARDLGVQRVVHTSTSEVYGTARYVPIDEEHPKQPQSPYSASKIGADMMAMSFYNAFDLPVTIARPFNTFGPRQSARAIIPTIISQIAAGKEVIEVGDLRPTRDFNYVEDTCRGFVALAESNEAVGQEVNIASNFEISMADTFDLIRDLMGSDVRFEVDEARIRPEKSEVFRLYGSNEKIRELTDFEPHVGFEDGLRRTIDWFTRPENLTRYKTHIYNV